MKTTFEFVILCSCHGSTVKIITLMQLILEQKQTKNYKYYIWFHSTSTAAATKVVSKVKHRQ